ncbi:MAG: response regulator [Polyangiaceae bacterium]|nr:response regulator [Polyangiaceae bacterium]
MPAMKAVVVDEKMGRASSAEINEADFGELNEEVSVAGQMLPKEAVPVPPGKKKVLVVDDEREIRVLIRRLLEERGHVVVEADRGRLGLQMLKLENPDLVVLDAMLPEVHGFDIAKRIRSSSRYGHIPIVMVSAVYRGWRFAQDAKQSYGVDAYLEKPFRVQELLTIVETALKDGRAPADPESINAEAEQLLNDGVTAYRAGGCRARDRPAPEGGGARPLRVPAPLPPGSAARQAGAPVRRDRAAGAGRADPGHPLSEPQEPRDPLPTSWVQEQSPPRHGSAPWAPPPTRTPSEPSKSTSCRSSGEENTSPAVNGPGDRLI